MRYPVFILNNYGNLFKIKTKVECDRSAHSDIQSAYSEELGSVFISKNTPKFGPYASFGYRDDFLGTFIVWVKRKIAGIYQWEIAEVVEVCVVFHCLCRIDVSRNKHS